MSEAHIFNRAYEIKRELANWLFHRVFVGFDEEVGSTDYIDFEDQDMRVFIRKTYGGEDEDDTCEYDVDIEFGNVPYSSNTISSSMDIGEITDIIDQML